MNAKETAKYGEIGWSACVYYIAFISTPQRFSRKRKKKKKRKERSIYERKDVIKLDF